MAWLGDLLIRLRTESADFVQGMDKAALEAERSMKRIEAAAAKLGATLSAGAFALAVKGAIDTADHISDISKVTGIAVEDLAGIGVAARQSGADLNSTAESMNKLSVNIGRNSDKYARLGITAKDPLEAFKQLSDIFLKIQDPQLRAAVGAEALGKSWAGAAPLLMEGSKNIGEMIERGSRLSGLNKEMADQADQFNDKLALIVHSGALWNGIAKEALPLLNSLADDLLKVQENADKVGDSFSLVRTVMETVLITGSEVHFTFSTLGQELARFAVNVQLIATGQWEASRQLGKSVAEDARRQRAELDKWQQKIMEVSRIKPNAQKALPTIGDTDPEVLRRAKEFAEQDDQLKKRQISALQQLEEKKKTLFNLNEQELMLARITTGTYRDFNTETKVRLLNLALEIDLRQEHIKVIEALLPGLQAEADMIERGAEVQKQYALQTRATVDQMKFETSLLGTSAREQEKANALRQIELDYRRQIADLARIAGDDMATYEREVAKLEEQRAQREREMLKAIEERQAKERDWATGSRDAFNEYIEHATNAAEQSKMLFGNAFRSMEDALVEMVKTGKLDFKSLADSIMSDLIRIQIRKAMASVMGDVMTGGGIGGGIFSFLGTSGSSSAAATSAAANDAFASGSFFADGGRPPVGRASVVGERGPELFVPDVAGTIIPDYAGGGGGPNVYIDARGADAAAVARLEQTVRGMDGNFNRRAVASMLDAQRRGVGV